MKSFCSHARSLSLNLYSARHYQTDEALYANFTKATGIRINRIEAGDDQIIERIRSEGANSPADVLLLVDAARIWSAQQMGLYAPVKSALLDSRIPAELRDKDGNWFGFSTRARVIVYNKISVKPEDAASYEALADPKLKGKVCTRSGSHPYMLSLVAAVTKHDGEAKAEQWAKSAVGNFTRKPAGGDSDQIKAVASGECGVALTNTYYWVRIVKSTKPEDIRFRCGTDSIDISRLACQPAQSPTARVPKCLSAERRWYTSRRMVIHPRILKPESLRRL